MEEKILHLEKKVQAVRMHAYGSTSTLLDIEPVHDSSRKMRLPEMMEMENLHVCCLQCKENIHPALIGLQLSKKIFLRGRKIAASTYIGLACQRLRI